MGSLCLSLIHPSLDERCTGESIDYSYEARLDDGGQCITGVEGHDGSLWVNVDGKQGGLGCMWLYEATDCRGYTAAWEFTANSESPPIGWPSNFRACLNMYRLVFRNSEDGQEKLEVIQV